MKNERLENCSLWKFHDEKGRIRNEKNVVFLHRNCKRD